jgi:dephospho-CoA kinase
MKNKTVIGLTGGSGTGKSTVAAALRRCGATVIDCDKLAHENMRRGGVAYAEIVVEFGDGILLPTGEIDRKALGAIVFNDADSLARLNGITHKHIVDRVKERIAECEGIIVIDAPLLRQVRLDSLCDKVWITDAPYETRLARITERDGITRQDAEARLKNQAELDYTGGDRRITTDFPTIAALNNSIKDYIKEFI